MIQSPEIKLHDTTIAYIFRSQLLIEANELTVHNGDLSFLCRMAFIVKTLVTEAAHRPE